MKFFKIGQPRQAYRYVINWGLVDFTDYDDYPYEVQAWQFCVWFARHNRKTIMLYKGKIRPRPE